MARKPGKNGKSSTPMATTLMLPSDNVLVGENGQGGLAETRRIQTQRSKSAAGVYRTRVGTAVEKDHLDAQAWALANRLADLDDDTLHVRYFHLLHYMEILGVVKRATAQEELFAAGETGPEPKAKNGKGADHEEDEDGDGAKHLGGAVREVAEKAGAKLTN